MIKFEQVPTECLIAYAEAHRTGGIPAGIAAALNAWPGLKLENLCGWVMDGPDLPYVEETASLILPLPQEPSDAER